MLCKSMVLLLTLCLWMMTILMTAQARPVQKKGQSDKKTNGDVSIKKKPQKAEQQSDDQGEHDGDDDYYSGSGTFFDPVSQGGAEGACGGKKESSSSDIVALNSAQYGPMNKKSRFCGEKVLIEYGNKKTVATVQDACPGCKEKSLDMTPSVFNKLADAKTGVIPIKWCFLGDKNCKQ
ncbi:RlpA-like double-psi beta-barrel-protein domain-containing protein-containing protein [Halteromyces radiatus]|uniref:RlpA-like double-psi beta-barrel-protein domain-containing protein-containing protein n=1 Tax=Halteromyces radiatus TaxID=101107 RepID=UPI00222104F9|nr:RlpA-like double-psi beta-barrel-protein domain-containing protein-containing protein [Halteromyces radiatus]KAI8096825.1 RlpA-like double-psi beta-barrel-protein domain-containing protein-containing protein [Halteromyces radiatus]